jgi:hypothetical protein
MSGLIDLTRPATRGPGRCTGAFDGAAPLETCAIPHGLAAMHEPSVRVQRCAEDLECAFAGLAQELIRHQVAVVRTDLWGPSDVVAAWLIRHVIGHHAPCTCRSKKPLSRARARL